MRGNKVIEEHIKPRLDDSFGRGMTMLIMMSSSKVANVSLVNIDDLDCRKLIQAICEDKRVIDMWGEAMAKERLREWERVLSG